MRVIICGAGQVGFSIAAYLSREDNDVTVIDLQPDLIARVNESLDANGIIGHASNPDVLDAAGANDADLIIAVTHSDEVNMVACQVAHSIFNVPKKIARIRNQSYLNPAWSNLFSRAHLPIDVIISPEKEVAQAIYDRLRVPGTTDVIGLADEKVHVVGVIAGDNCPVVNTPLKQLSKLFPQLNIKVAAILRANKPIIPDQNEQILVGDEVYFFTDTRHMHRALATFGHEEKALNHAVTIMGGGNIGLFLARIMHEHQSQIRIKVIESNLARAMYLSEQMKGVTVLHGDGLDPKSLEDAGIGTTEALVAVTNDDETNILGSIFSQAERLQARYQPCQQGQLYAAYPLYGDRCGCVAADHHRIQHHETRSPRTDQSPPFPARRICRGDRGRGFRNVQHCQSGYRQYQAAEKRYYRRHRPRQ